MSFEGTQLFTNSSHLKNIIHEKDDKKKREVIKKVIAYMTLGF